MSPSPFAALLLLREFALFLEAERLNGTVKSVTATTANPDGTQSVSVTQNGRKVGDSLLDSGGGTLAGTGYYYNNLGQVTTQSDARNGNTTLTYDNIGRVTSVTTPAPGGGSAEVTSYVYSDSAADLDGGLGSTVAMSLAAGGGNLSTGAQEFYPTGELGLSYGASGPAEGLTYDYAGRRETLTTWQDYGNGTGAAVTTWYYNDAGMVVDKLYTDNSGPSYTYDNAGHLLTRTGARTAVNGSGNLTPLVTTWSYNGTTGDETGVAYSSNLTANVTLGGYDRLGRPTTISDGSGNRTITYAHGQVTGESYGSGALNGFTLTRALDGVYHVNEVKLAEGNTTLSDVFYSYSNATGLLGNVTWGNETATYSYVSNSTLTANTTFAHLGGAKLATSRSYDALNRLTEIDNTPSTYGEETDITYTLNGRNQRTKATQTGGSYWSYGYDSDGSAGKTGQVTSGIYYANAGGGSFPAMPGDGGNYTYDDMGNRKTFAGVYTSGNYYVDPDPASSGTGANLLNQYGSRDVPRVLEESGQVADGYWIDVLSFNGTPPSGANVTVTPNVAWPTEVQWYANLTFSGNNANGPQWTTVNISANSSGNYSNVTGNMYLPANPEVYSYDSDGNLLADGRWNYVWDAENRLSALVTTDEAHSAGVPMQSITFGYDSQNRRIGKTVYDYNAAGNGTWVLTQSVKYLYDGYNLIAEMNAMPSTPTVVRTYAWGLDLSGTTQGAGGVGGLLMANLSDNSTTKTVYYGYDGNGNVITLADTSGNVVATYDYDPSGNTVRATGSWAVFNPIRFSTKYNETSGTYAGRDVGLIMYPSRPYSPSMARWTTRDPSEESGGLNIYGTGNDLVNKFDPLGLWTLPNRNGNNAWASVIAQTNDTWDSLAKMIHLNTNEYRKWVRTTSSNGSRVIDPLLNAPQPCHTYLIPNAISVYTSKPTAWLRDGLLSSAYVYRQSALNAGYYFEDQGFQIFYDVNQSSKEEFINEWRREGLYGVIFAGHGDYTGAFISDPDNGDGVDASQVHPAYQLAFVYALACYTYDWVRNQTAGTAANPIYGPYMNWRQHIAPGGGFIGGDGLSNYVDNPPKTEFPVDKYPDNIYLNTF